MSTTFEISSWSEALELDENRAVEAVFSVTNRSDAEVAASGSIASDIPAFASWVQFGGAFEAPFAPGESRQVRVEMVLDPSVEAGVYPFRLVVQHVAAPTDEPATSAPVTLYVRDAAAPAEAPPPVPEAPAAASAPPAAPEAPPEAPPAPADDAEQDTTIAAAAPPPPQPPQAPDEPAPADPEAPTVAPSSAASAGAASAAASGASAPTEPAQASPAPPPPPSQERKKGGFPVWAIVLIAVGGAIVIGGIVALVVLL